jgi:hypothetical protein
MDSFFKYFVKWENILHVNSFIIIPSYLKLCVDVVCCVVDLEFLVPHSIKFLCQLNFLNLSL